MKHRKPRFTPNLLRLAIAAGLLAPGTGLANPGLQAADGPGGTPRVNPHNGVPVIDIVAPSASGLSHNQFLDYNVGQPGVVLNNALQAGTSQLAGTLGANPQFHGQAASTILNEVISRNASTIEGPQEIFGRPADYILANPNGITVNGGSFINTTKAGLLVGRPDIEDQRLGNFDSLTASGMLKIGDKGLGNASGALALIAPRIHSSGALDAEGDLDIIAGRNLIGATHGGIIKHQPTTPGSIDVSLFAPVQAGRIRIISTAEGAGVRIDTPSMKARDGISIESAGDLTLNGSRRERSRIDTGEGALGLKANSDLRLTAVDARAGKIDVKAGKRLTLDSKTRETINRDNEKWDKKWWFVTTETYDRERTVTEQTSLGSQLTASGAVTLEAGETLHLSNAKVKSADDLTLSSSGTLEVSAGVDSRQVDEKIRHRKHLWRGDKDSSEYSETAKPSELYGRTLKLEAKERTVIAGSTLRSGSDLSVNSPDVDIGVARQSNSDTRTDYRGDLVSGAFFGNRGKSEGSATKHLGSQIVSGGAVTVVADQVRVSGSRISSKGDALLASERAVLSIEAAKDSTSRTTRQSDSKVFGLLNTTSERQQQSNSTLVSDVASDSNLRLASADELRVIGSKLRAEGELKLTAATDLTIDVARESGQTVTRETSRGFYANARETLQAGDGKPGSSQYNASVGYQVSQSESSDKQTALVSSQLSAGSIALDSKAAVNVDGSTLNADKGAITIDAQQVTLGAQYREQEQTRTTTRSGGGLAVTGGMDRVGSAWEGFRQEQVREEISRDARGSELKAAGDIQTRTPALVNEAAKVEAGGALVVDAQQVENRATATVRKVRESERNWNGQLGLSVEVRDLTRPVENLVTGNEAARFQQASIEDAFAPPTLGADLSLEHLNRQESRITETANVSELSAASVQLKADTLSDTGTRYTANGGTVQIDAGSHRFTAAQDTTTETVERLDVNGALRVETATGKDIAVRLTGKGGSLSSTAATTTARPGNLYGQQGIQIQLGSDGLYEGTAFNGGKGAVSVNAGGDVQLTQANDTQQQTLRKLDGTGWTKAGNAPTGTGLELRGYLDHSQRSSSDSQARVASIDAEGDIKLTSGDEMTLVGARIGDPKTRPTAITLKAQGPLQVLAATDTHEATGSNIGGGGEVLIKQNDAGMGGGLGGHFSNGRVAESSSKATGTVFTAKNTVRLESKDHSDQAIHLQGLQAEASEIIVVADNGGVLIESAQSTEHRDNLDLTAGAGISKAPAETKADTKKALHGRAQLNLDQLDSLLHLNSELNGQQVSLNSLNDMQLNGARVNAERIAGQIGGDLLVASQMDRVNSLKLDVDARLSREKNPQGYLNATRALTGPFSASAEKKVGSAVQKADPGLSPTLDLKVDHRQLSSVAAPSRVVGRDGIGLEVAGEVRLSGADLRAPRGKVELGTNRISTETLAGRDYRRVVGTNLSNAPVELGTDLVNTYKDGAAMGLEDGDASVDLGLLRTGGHDRAVSVGSQVISRK